MKVAEVSAFNNFSVGTIMNSIKDYLLSKGEQCNIYYFRNKQDTNVYLGNTLLLYVNTLISRVFDNDGFVPFSGVYKLINKLKEFKPDIVHIHCLHGYYMDSSVLFKYFRESGIKVIWTMHDSWAFTGHCTYFDLKKCEKWKETCFKCPLLNDYPKSIFDFSKRNYERKREVFTSLDHNQLYIVSPSAWLDNIISQSFLKKYRHRVVYNSINLGKFKNYGHKREKVLLAVSSVWDARKNLSKVLEISQLLREWKVIVIGKLLQKIDRKKFSQVTFINRTESIDDLIEFYNKASILINPTLADNYPSVNIEAQKCGLKVLTYNTGGCIETNLGQLYLFNDNDIINDDYLNNILKTGDSGLDRPKGNDMELVYYNLFKEVISHENR